MFSCDNFTSFFLSIGRTTIEHSNRNSTVNNNTTPASYGEMRITANPLNLNYCEPEDCVATSFCNPTHVELPSAACPVEVTIKLPIVDSSTYCKSRGERNINIQAASDDDLEVW